MSCQQRGARCLGCSLRRGMVGSVRGCPELRQDLLGKSCYLGIVSHGIASGDGSAERSYLIDNVLISQPFKDLAASNSQVKVWSLPTGRWFLPLCLHGLMDWSRMQSAGSLHGMPSLASISLLRKSTSSVITLGTFHLSGKAQGYNAREISCQSRDYSVGNGIIGLCGATRAIWPWYLRSQKPPIVLGIFGEYFGIACRILPPSPIWCELHLFLFYSPNSVATLGVLMVKVQARCSIQVVSEAFGIFPVNFRTKCLLWILVTCPCSLRLRRLAQNAGRGISWLASDIFPVNFRIVPHKISLVTCR